MDQFTYHLAGPDIHKHLLTLLRPLRPAAAISAGGNCNISINNSGVADYTSADASALQSTVDDASPGDELKIAGACVGTGTRLGVTQTVYISKSLSLQGGFDADDWALPPDPELNETFLNAMDSGRGGI